MLKTTNKKIASLKEALQIIAKKSPEAKKNLLVWFDGDFNELETLPLPPALHSPDLIGSWSYLKGVRELVLEIIPDFEEIHWTDIDIY